MDDLKARLTDTILALRGRRMLDHAVRVSEAAIELSKQADRIEKLEAENARLDADCEKAWEAYRIAFDRAISNGEALQEARATLSDNGGR